MEEKKYHTLLGINGELIKGIYGHNEILYVHETWQFSDYEQYEAGMFDLSKRRKQREEQFPKDLKASYEMGMSLVNTARKV